MVIQDDVQILISSRSFLLNDREDNIEFGLHIARQSSGCGACPPASDALEWAWQNYAHYEDKKFFRRTFADFYTREEAARIAQREKLNETPQPVCPVQLEPGDPWKLDACASQLWQLCWLDYSRTLYDIASRHTAIPKLLVDGDHRGVVAQGLRTAKTRLLIAANRLGPEIVTSAFLERVRELLRDGVQVTLMHRPLSGVTQSEREAVVSGFESIKNDESLSGNFRRIERDSFSNLLVIDDTVVISSFNHLSLAGTNNAARPKRRRLQRSDVGVVLTDRELANRILQGVRQIQCEAVEDWAVAPLGDTSDSGSIFTPPVSPEVQQHLLREINESWEYSSGVKQEDVCESHPSTPAEISRRYRNRANAAKILHEYLDFVVDPQRGGEAVSADAGWWLLRRLREAEFPRELLKITSAAMLARDPESVNSRNWMQWLAEDAWTHREYSESLLLCAGGKASASEILPSSDVVLLAASWQNNCPGIAIEELSSRGGLSDSERTLTGIAALIGAATKGSSAEIIELFKDDLPGPWRDVHKEFWDYYRTAWEKLPMEQIQLQLRTLDQRKLMDDAWNALAAAIVRGETVNFQFDSGTKTHEWLFHPDGNVFGALRTHAHARDVTQISNWLKTPPSNIPWIDDLGALIDHATRIADDSERYLGAKGGIGKRRSYLKVLREIVSSAERVVAVVGPHADQRTSKTLDAAKVFARALVVLWPQLVEYVSSRPGPIHVVSESMLRTLLPVKLWGDSQ